MERLLSPAGFHNYRSILSFMSSLAARHASEAAWYLSIIGVHPSAQGRGIGQELLTPTLSEADEKQATCYLETFTPRSIGFYVRLGFKSADCYEEPTTRSTYVLMRRDAQPAASEPPRSAARK
jgi:ribosomal protein S18 acetylase RimI-like enzyme